MNSGPGSVNSGPGKAGVAAAHQRGEVEARGRANQPGEDVQGRRGEMEARGRANQPGEDRRSTN